MRLVSAAALALAVFCYSAADAAETYAPSPLSAQQVFAKAAAARGAIGKGTYRRVYSSTIMNGIPTRRELLESGEDYRETTRDGGFTTLDGSSNGTLWWQSPNGTVTVDSFHQNESPYAMALRPEAAGSRLRVLGTTAGEPSLLVVEIRPGGSLSEGSTYERRFYDAKTFLLRRVEHTGYDGKTAVTTFDNFITKFGLTVAQSISFDDGEHPQNAVSSHLESFERVSTGPTVFAIPQSRQLFDLDGRPSLRIPADFTADGIIVRLNVGGRGLDFLLDSAASPMIIDAGVARSLGLTLTETHAESFDGNIKVAQTRIPSLSLGEIQAHDVAMRAIRFRLMVGTRQVVGLLGGDFFASARISVNFIDSTLWMEAPTSAAPPAPWKPVPIEIDDLTPRAHAKFNGVDGAFMIDLGSEYTMMYGHYFSQFKPTAKAEIIGVVVGGHPAAGIKEYHFSRFDFGDLAFEGGTAIVPEGTSWEDEDYDGALGRDILSTFDLLFDYANRRLYVRM